MGKLDAMENESKSDKKDYLLYEKTARTYDCQRFTGRAGEWGHNRQISILHSLAEDWQGKKVLEIGCGTGRITQALARWGADITATDISEKMLKLARTRFSSDQELAMPKFRVMSVFDIDMDLQGYDYVIMVNVLGRLSHAREAIEKISLNISETCRFVFTFPSLTSILLPFGLTVNLRSKSLARDVTSHWYTPKTIEKYCNDAGLMIVGWRGNHYVPVPRLLFPTLPFFWTYDKCLAKSFPKRCPSVFVVSKLWPTDKPG
jgi:2-polyprenyl-3-methyl-5-hydroxy-6-metoxy-1,4-benzoquinol methylase